MIAAGTVTAIVSRCDCWDVQHPPGDDHIPERIRAAQTGLGAF